MRGEGDPWNAVLGNGDESLMKIRVKVKSVNTGSEWTEDYDKNGIGDNGNVLQAKDWAHQLVESFNEVGGVKRDSKYRAKKFEVCRKSRVSDDRD